MSYKDLYQNDILTSWLDNYGMIGLDKDSPTHITENGLYFSAIHVVLCHKILRDSAMKRRRWFVEKVRKCYLQTGNLARQPNNNTNQEAWDNYLGVAIACMCLNINDIPREILKYGVANLGFYNTDGKLEFKDWLWRFPQVWVMMIAAAFPILRPLFMLPAYLISLFMKKKEGDSSGNNLVFMYMYGMKLLGFNKLYTKKVEELKVKENFSLYFKINHPFNLLLGEQYENLK